MKTINNKQYNECSVVMLATDKAEDCLLLKQGLGNKALGYHKGYFTKDYLQSIYAKSYHLYILSDEEINVGDWYYWSVTNTIQKAIKDSLGRLPKIEDGSKKLIATTDFLTLNKSLEDGLTAITLPQIPQSFIDYFVEQFNKGNVIDKVLVEGSYYKAIRKDNCPFYKQPENGAYMAHDEHGWETLYPEYAIRFEDFRTKINPDNTINILTQKDSWTREEVETVLLKLMREQIKFPSYNSYEMEKWYAEWISKNL